MREAAVAGIGRTPFSKNSGRTPLAMAAEAARAALDDAGLRPTDVDGIIDFSTGDSAPGPDVRGLSAPSTSGWRWTCRAAATSGHRRGPGHHRRPGGYLRRGGRVPVAQRPFRQPLRPR